MGVQDALWLEMDRPTNLMVIDSLVWTAEPIDWDRFVEVIQDRVWNRYRVFRSIAVRDDRWYWEERSDDTFESHLTFVRLPEPGGDAELQDLVAFERTVPLDRSRPLWSFFCIDGYRDGSAVLTRTHHAIADGIRMVQIAMSLFDAAPDGGAILAPPVRLHGDRTARPSRSRRERVRGDVGAVAGELAGLARGALAPLGRVVRDPGGAARGGLDAVGNAVGGVRRAAQRSTELRSQSLTNPVGAAHGAMTDTAHAAESMASWLGDALQPRLPGEGPLVDLLSASPGDADFGRKLLLGTRNDPTIWTGKAGPRKMVAWSEPLPLPAVKQVAREHDATVNDVLVTCLAGALQTYLDHHDRTCASTTWMIPVNLKPLDHTLPEELGNEFAIVQLELPTDLADPLDALDVVRHRMGRIKSGHEAGLAFRIQELISGFSSVLYRASVDLLASRAVGVITNVPGPPVPVYLAGRRVEGMVGWAPLTGDQAMSFTLYSYDDQVFVGIACDADLVPDHEQLVEGFGAAFERLSAAVR
jgi:diacylglycerol O-acyltransferase